MKTWSWQCHDCYGAHKDIIVRTDRPEGNHVCPFCGGVMHVYELGGEFRTLPPVKSVETYLIGKDKYRKAA